MVGRASEPVLGQRLSRRVLHTHAAHQRSEESVSIRVGSADVSCVDWNTKPGDPSGNQVREVVMGHKTPAVRLGAPPLGEAAGAVQSDLAPVPLRISQLQTLPVMNAWSMTTAASGGRSANTAG